MTFKPMRTSFLALGLILALSLSAVAAAVPDFVQLAQKNKPAVVNISTSKTVTQRAMPQFGPGSPFDDFFNHFFNGMPNQPRHQRSLGSGFIISNDGYILTNDHVVDGADEIKVKLSDGRTFPATVKGVDSKLDLALIKVEAEGNLPTVSLGDSDKLQVGEWVMAIGNPFGLEQTVTAGIVSAKGRVIGAGPYDDFIQTDASINPGNSGGPLFNADGQVVGINTAIIAGGQGIGFAIPVNSVTAILDQLRTSGKVTRGWLGVAIQQMTPELAKSFGLDKEHGALVTEVTKNSPAEKAGLQRGDVILSFDGHEIKDMRDLPRLVAATPVNQTVKMQILRDGKTRDIRLVVGKMADEGPAKVEKTAEGSTWEKFGLVLREIDGGTAQQYGLEPGVGLVITDVNQDGPAADAGLHSGDIVLEANGKPTNDLNSFQAATEGAAKAGVLRLLIKRQDNLLYVALKLK